MLSLSPTRFNANLCRRFCNRIGSVIIGYILAAVVTALIWIVSTILLSIR
jgi:hypothetical protein